MGKIQHYTFPLQASFKLTDPDMNLSLQSARLIYSPIQLSDAEEVFIYAKEEEVARFTSWEAHQSIQDTEAFLHHVVSRHNETAGCIHIVFAMRLQQSGPAIGTISFRQSSREIAHIDYALSQNYWGQGLVTEAVKNITDWAFIILPELTEIHSGCLIDNRGSVRVLEKCGFRRQNTYYSRRQGKFNNRLLGTGEYVLYRKSA